jgi:hypothetical protein
MTDSSATAALPCGKDADADSATGANDVLASVPNSADESQPDTSPQNDAIRAGFCGAAWR